MYPTRTGRFGVALVESGTMRLKAQEYASDLDPIEVGCQCPTCKTVSRGYLHNMLKEDDALAAQYITLHNVSYMMRLMRSMREVVLANVWISVVHIVQIVLVLLSVIIVTYWTVSIGHAGRGVSLRKVYK